MTKYKVLIVEDNADTRYFLETALSKQYEVYSAENAVVGIELATVKKPDVILLDIMMPIMNGYDACKVLKSDERTKNIPVIFVSAKNSTMDIVDGLELGADDYISKPFDLKELIARIQVRVREKVSRQTEHKTLVHENLKLVLDTHETFYDGRLIELTFTEFDILKLLIQCSGKTINRDEIIENVWKNDKDNAKKRTIDVHIRAIRKKIPQLKKHLTSIYGLGYKFE